MNKGKGWTICTLLLTSVMLIASAILVIKVDPFMQYTVDSEIWQYPLSEPVSINAGVAKNYDYEALLTGSSVTVNFPVSLFEKNTIKLSAQGLRLKGSKEIVELALKNNQNLETIYWGVDIFNIGSKPEATGPIIPDYLYNDSYIDDVNYWWNKDILFDEIPDVFSYTKKGRKTMSMDDRYSWYLAYDYSEKRVLDSIPNLSENNVFHSEEQKQEFLKNARINLEENLISLIRENPNVEFCIFFPPVSICYWKVTDYEFWISVEKEIVNELLKCDNVSVYNFQSEKDIITNLYLYKDYIHYSEAVDKWIIQCLDEKSHLLTDENYEIELDRIKEIVETYDWKYLLQRDGTYRVETDMEKYFRMLQNEDYIMIIFGNMKLQTENKLYALEVLSQYGIADEFMSEIEKYYIQIIDNGTEVMFDVKENLKSELYVYNDMDIEIKTERTIYDGKEYNYYSGIYVDDIRYCQDDFECNLIIYDKVRGRVVDAVGLDLETRTVVRN